MDIVEIVFYPHIQYADGSRKMAELVFIGFNRLGVVTQEVLRIKQTMREVCGVSNESIVNFHLPHLPVEFDGPDLETLTSGFRRAIIPDECLKDLEQHRLDNYAGDCRSVIVGCAVEERPSPAVSYLPLAIVNNDQNHS